MSEVDALIEKLIEKREQVLSDEEKKYIEQLFTAERIDLTKERGYMVSTSRKKLRK